MTPQEAYTILNVSQDISDEDLKRAYKKLAKEHHPDKTGDQETFKKINSAHQLILDHRQNPHKHQSPFSSGGFNINLEDVLSNFAGMNGNKKQKSHNNSNINIDINLTFKESILGASKDITYERLMKCDGCDGQGLHFKHNGCKNCNGFGRVVNNSGNMMFSSSCNKCFGRNVQNEACIKCTGKGVLSNKTNLTIPIPPGTSDKTVLHLRGAGHFNGASMFGEAYSSVLLRILVESDDFLSLDGENVSCTINIPLIDALLGCIKEIKTINGQKEIQIPALSKNKEEIKLKGLGVKNTNGAQVVKISVDYPNDTTSLINFLKEQNVDKH